MKELMTRYHFWMWDWHDESKATNLESLEPLEPLEPLELTGTDWNYWKCWNPQFQTWQSPYKHYYTIDSTLFH